MDVDQLCLRCAWAAKSGTGMSKLGCVFLQLLPSGQNPFRNDTHSTRRRWRELQWGPGMLIKVGFFWVLWIRTFGLHDQIRHQMLSIFCFFFTSHFNLNNQETDSEIAITNSIFYSFTQVQILLIYNYHTQHIYIFINFFFLFSAAYYVVWGQAWELRIQWINEGIERK